MLVERPYPREYTYAQQNTYLRNQRMIELQGMMKKLKPFPIKTNEGYNKGVLANESQCQQLLTQIGCYSMAPSLSSTPTVHNNQSYFLGGSAHRRFTKMNPKVSAFGPKHAEHARRFYQSEGKTPGPQWAMVPPIGSNYEPTYYRQSGVNNGSNFLGDPVFSRCANNSTTSYTMSAEGRGLLPKISRPSETVLKVARISPRPKSIRPKTSSSIGVTKVTKKIDEELIKKSDDFQDSMFEKDLKNAPLFQILCEISKN